MRAGTCLSCAREIDEAWRLPAAYVHVRNLALRLIEPGMRVVNPARPEWGVGQVQSVLGSRVTVNFENAGKLLINAALVVLDVLP